MKEWVNGLAEELEKEGIQKGQFAKAIEKELNESISYETITRYLDIKFKRSEYQKTELSPDNSNKIADTIGLLIYG